MFNCPGQQTLQEDKSELIGGMALGSAAYLLCYSPEEDGLVLRRSAGA